MEDPTDEVDICLHSLRCKNVVYHKLKPIFELSRNISISLVDHFLHVLDDNREIGEDFGQFHCDVSGTSTNIDHFNLAQRFPVVVVNNMRRIVLLHAHIRFHAVCKSLGSLGICSQNLIDALCSPIC